MGDLLRSFLVSVPVRTKHAEKTRVGLWGQSTILKADVGMLQVVSEQTSPSTVWFGDEPSGSWWACNTQGRWRMGVVAGAQGMTMSGS